MTKNMNLLSAKVGKNDEFYTQYKDVERELLHYKHHYRNKTVYCNCDDPSRSAFWKYFHLNFAELGLKKLISTHYDREEATYKMEYTGGNDNDIEVGVKTPLEGNGGFRNQECLDLLNECDIVVTNPPFSLFSQLITTLLSYDKKFLVIGNKNAIGYKDFFPLLQKDTVWLGYNNIKNFDRPDGTVQNFGNIGWFTNLEIDKQNEFLELTRKYDAAEMPTYKNYGAININRVKDIPKDYFGIMGVPISFLDKYNPTQFEIVGMDRNSQVEKLGIDKIGGEMLQRYFEQGGKGHYTENMHSLVYLDHEGKVVFPYRRLLIRRKENS